MSTNIGNININGIKSIIFLSKAKNNEIFAFPRDKNVCWQDICAPKINIPAKYIFILFDVICKSDGSLLNIFTTTSDDVISNSQAAAE